MIPFVDFKTQTDSLRQEMEQSFQDFLKSSYFILGENVSKFEQEFAAFCGVPYAVGVASGTDALKLSLVACGVKAGDEVITVAHTAVPTILAISAIGATPVFIDIKPETLTLDPAKIEEKITPKTKAIIPVHLYGHPASIKEIMQTAKKHNLFVIEDGCQAHGASVENKKVGTWGDLGCFSFYPTKNLGAYGDGGMIVTNNKEFVRNLQILRNCGQASRYEHLLQGYNSRLDELQASFLRVKLKYLDKWNQKRHQKAGIYIELLKDLPLILPKEKIGSSHVYHLFVIRTEQRDALMNQLKEKGIQTLIHYPIPAHLQKAYANLGYKKGDLPVTEKVVSEILSLPLYPELEEDHIQTISQALHEILS